MTDNEIIEALEQEIHSAEYVDSDYCSNVYVGLIKSALDLINRQQEEIEKLQMMIDSDNEVCTECHCEYMDKVHQARIEAIKEFARRLKSKAKDEFMYDYKMLTMATEFVVVKEIDNLVKEMVGDTE